MLISIQTNKNKKMNSEKSNEGNIELNPLTKRTLKPVMRPSLTYRPKVTINLIIYHLFIRNSIGFKYKEFRRH